MAGLLAAATVAVVSVDAASGAATPSARAETRMVGWLPLDKALQQAKARRQPVFLMVYAQWCGYCAKLDRSTFTDPEVARLLNTRFAPSRLDAEGSQQLVLGKDSVAESTVARELGVQGFPTLVFFDPDGKELGRIPSYLGADEMKDALNQTLAFLAKKDAPGDKPAQGKPKKAAR